MAEPLAGETAGDLIGGVVRELERIRARTDQATLGPWQARMRADGQGQRWWDLSNPDHSVARLIEDAVPDEFIANLKADAEFIASSRMDLPMVSRALEVALTSLSEVDRWLQSDEAPTWVRERLDFVRQSLQEVSRIQQKHQVLKRSLGLS